jgi:hypothetical protein
MAQELIDKIRAAAQAKNVNPDVAVQIARNESSLNPSARADSSSAAGLFGVIDSTWKQFGGQPGKKLNPDENIRVGVDVIASNTDFLRRNLGREPSPSEIYTAHFFGPAGARTILNAAPDTPVSSLFSAQVLEANPHLKGKTAEQARQWLSKKMGGVTPARAQAPATAAPQPAVMEPPLGISASAAPRAVAIGDSLAEGFAKANNLGGVYKSGAGPQAVMKMLQDYAANNTLKGMTVYLGTGLPNNPAQRDAVAQQVAFIKAQGGTPVVFGAGPGSQRNPTTGQNEFLQTVAQDSGARFTGPLATLFPAISKQDPMGLHLTPAQYKELYKQTGGAPVTAAASRPAAAQAAPRAAAAQASAEDLGSGYKAALALAFLGDQDKDREVSDDELRTRMNRIEDEEFAQQLADYKPVNALQDLEITALNPVKALQPVKMADGGEAKKDESKNDSAMRVRGAARAALDKVVSLGMGPGMGANLGYNLYKHFSGKTPLEDLLRDARQANQPIDPTRDMEPMSTTGGLSGGMPPVRRSNGSPEDGEMLLNKGNALTGSSTPPRFAAKELDAYIKAANPGATVLEYEQGPGGALGFVHSKLPDVINIKRGQTPGTREQTLLHELEHTLDDRGGDIFGRPEIRRMDNNYRAYYLLNRQWKPIEQFVQSVIENQDRLKNFFGQDIVSGYITMSPENLKKLQRRGDARGLFSEQIASLSALEQATGKSLTRDPEMRKLFPDTKMMAVYDALTGLRQTRTDARDLPPHTPLPSYTYETNPVMRFIREKTTGKNEYGIPIKRANGGEAEPTPEELAAASRPATFNPQIARQGAAARALAAQRDVNTLPDPRTYAAVSGFLGQAPDQLGFSVFHPDLQGIKRAGEAGFAVGLVPAVAPVVAPVARAVGRGATALGMRTEKALEAPVTRTLERGGRSAEMLQALGAQPSFAIKPRGGHFELRPDASGPGMAVWDDVRQTVSDHLANTKDQQLNNWFNAKVTAYLRRDFGTESDQFVKAADAGKKLHLPNEPMDPLMRGSIQRAREIEGFPKSGFATTEYGRNIEDSLDASLNIRELGDLTIRYPLMNQRVPPSLMQFSATNPEMRLYSLDEIVERGPRLGDLRDRMLELRGSNEVRFYGEPPVKIPDSYRITDQALQGLSPVQASEKVAQFDNWRTKVRQRAATSAIRKNPQANPINAGDGHVWVNPPDLAQDKNMRQLVQDVGCDGKWCTREEAHSLSYGSGNSRLSILIDDKARPVAQLTVESVPPSPEKFIRSLSPEQLKAFVASNPLYKYADRNELAAFAETSPQYAEYLRTAPRNVSITELRGYANTMDLTDSPSLKKIQDRIRDLDRQYGVGYVENLRGVGLTEIPKNRPDLILNYFDLPAKDRLPLKEKFGSETAGFKAILDEAINMNKGSKYFSGNDNQISDLFRDAARTVLRSPANFATGGMVERKRTDNRAYL